MSKSSGEESSGAGRAGTGSWGNGEASSGHHSQLPLTADFYPEGQQMESLEKMATFRNSEDCYPLEGQELLVQKLLEEKKILQFPNGEKLTDAILHSLQLAKDQLAKVETLNLLGCVNITDVGISWLAETLSACPLKQIILDGCRNITEDSIIYLCRHVKKDMEVSLVGTDVAFVPQVLLVERPGMRYQLQGCPLLELKDLGDSGSSEEALNLGSITVCPHKSVEHSVATYLISKKKVPRQPIEYGRWGLKDLDLSVLEISADHVAADLLIRPTPNIVIPVMLLGSLTDNSDYIISTILNFITRLSFRPKGFKLSVMTNFTVVCLLEGQTSAKEGLDSLEEYVRSQFEVKMTALQKFLENEIENLKDESKEKQIDFSCHRRYTQCLVALEQLKRFQHRGENRFLHTYALDLVSGEGYDGLVQHLTDIQYGEIHTNSHLYKYLPKYYNIFKALLGTGSKKMLTIDQVREMCNSQVDTYNQVYDRILRLLHDWGKVLYFRERSPPIVVTDIQWFVTILNSLLDMPKDTAGMAVKCLSSGTQLWKDTSLHQVALESIQDQQLEDVLDLIISEGQLIRLPCFRDNPYSTKYYLLHPDHLGEPPAPIQMPGTKKLLQIQRTYTLPAGLTMSQWSAVLSAVTQCCRPLILGCDSLRFHQGAVEVDLTFTNQKGVDFDVINLTVRGYQPSPPEGSSYHTHKEAVEDHVLGVLGIFSDIVEYTLSKREVLLSVRQNYTQKPSRESICFEHAWGRAGDTDQISVCTICQSCSNRGMSCEYNGIMGDTYRQCGCDTTYLCCVECGICQSCAYKLWTMRSYLRPSLMDGRPSALFLGDHLNHQMSPAILNEAHFTMYSDDNAVTINLRDKMASHLIQVFPGKPAILARQTSFGVGMGSPGLEATQFEHLTDTQDPTCRYRKGDRITVRLKPAQKMPVTNSSHVESNSAGNGFPNMSIICHNVEVSELSGHIWTVYKEDMDDDPMGMLVGTTPLQSLSYFEIDIINEDPDGGVCVGVVPLGFNPASHMGRDRTSVPWYFQTSEGRIFKEGEELTDQYGQLQDAGSTACRLGFGIKLLDSAAESVSVFFSKAHRWRGTERIEAQMTASIIKIPNHKEGLVAAVWLKGKNNLARLLHRKPWTTEDESSTVSSVEAGQGPKPGEGEFMDDLIKMSPSEALLFARPNKVTDTSTLTLSLSSVSGNVAFKVKTTQPKYYVVRPNSGILSADGPPTVITIGHLGGGPEDISADKFLIQYQSCDGTVTNVSQVNWYNTQNIRNRKFICGWSGESVTQSIEPLVLPDVDSRVPTEPTFCLEVIKNGRTVSATWIPAREYYLAISDAHPGQSLLKSMAYATPFEVPVDWSLEIPKAAAISGQHVGLMATVPTKCKDQKHSFTVLESRLAKGNTIFKNLEDPYMSTYCVFLPKDMDGLSLLYPSLDHLCNSNMLAVYDVCVSGNARELYSKEMVMSPIHFVDSCGTPLKNEFDLTYVFEHPVLGLMYTSLGRTKVRLPSYQKLLPQVDTRLSRNQVETCLQVLLSYFATVCMLLSSNVDENKQTMQASCPDLGPIIEQATGIKRSENVDLGEDEKFRDPSKLIGPQCKAHHHADALALGESKTLDLQAFEPYGEHLTILSPEIQGLTAIPDDLPQAFPMLEILELKNADCLELLPAEMSCMQKLKAFHIRKRSKVKALPKDIGDCLQLQDILCYRSLIEELPESVGRAVNLHRITAHSMLLKQVPQDIKYLWKLTKLDISHNAIDHLPAGFGDLQALQVLKIMGVPWGSAKISQQPHSHKTHLTKTQFDAIYNDHHQMTKILSKEELDRLFKQCDKNHSGMLEEDEAACLNAHLFYMVPRLGHGYEDGEEFGGMPEEIFHLRQLQELHLSYQAIKFVPDQIENLTKLHTLNLNRCVCLGSLTGALGFLPKLNTLSLRGCPSLRTPPPEIVGRGTEAVKAYLKRLAGGFTENWRTKLMLVGLGGAGKTSLLRALMSNSSKTKELTGEEITDGIDIKTWKLRHSSGQDVTYSAWDFAGQTVYYNTHQFFLSKRAVYLLLWTTRLGFEHAGLDFWLSSIQCHAPKAPIFVIGTHCDQVAKAELPQAELQRQYPQIRGFHFVSNITGDGVAELRSAILDVTMGESYMGEKIPQVYLDLETKILEGRKQSSVMEWQQVQQYGMDAGIYEEKDVKRAVQFLHDLGTVQYFDNEFLREHIVINPQWIVDVMACIVSVKDSPIQDGRFCHSDIGKVWEAYDSQLHDWLLRLTEEFDLTFPLPREPVNLVPCLLPHSEPEFEWPHVEDDPSLRENLLLYRFVYLPAGLFNRIQVRLFQFSDGRVIWKRGSLLKKNGHLALVKQHSDKELSVKVQGPQPENILFLVHEVIETLIAESFQGVTYDYLLPCPDCVSRAGTRDPCLFEASLIQEAADWNAAFLQCRKYFHTVSMPILQASMPPDNSSDIDVHLRQSVQTLDSLRTSLCNDIFISYCEANVPEDADPGTYVHPQTVVDDLVMEGYTCWYREKMSEMDVSDVTVSLRDSKVVLVFLSNEYEKDEQCRRLFLYARQTLRKPCLVAVVGQGMEWQKTHVGMIIGPQEVYINLQRPERYTTKLVELKEQLRLKMMDFDGKKEFPSCFISYCWANSHAAVRKGSRKVEGALGWADPRNIKDVLEQNGISCWIDTEQAGKSGLFEDITTGIKHAKVTIACVSKEYAKSNNCMMELRFATCTLNKPLVVVVVGTGEDWQWTEIGMLMQKARAPQVNLQEEDQTALDRLVRMVKKKIAEVSDMERTQEDATEGSTSAQTATVSFQEEYELAQRKFMRHISMLASSMDTLPYPRLILLDFSDLPAHRQNDETKVRPKLIQRSTSKTSRKHSLSKTDSGSLLGNDVHEAWESESFCLKALCEHEQEWHLSTEVLHLNVNDMDGLLLTASPYLARIYTLLQHSGTHLNCFHGSKSEAFLEYINQCAKETPTSDLFTSYSELRQTFITKDTDYLKAGLERCHLPTGKINWLCEEHQKGNRVTVMSTDVMATSSVQPLVLEEDLLLRQYVDQFQHMRDKYIKQKRERRMIAQTAAKDGVVSSSSKSEKPLQQTSAKATSPTNEEEETFVMAGETHPAAEKGISAMLPVPQPRKSQREGSAASVRGGSKATSRACSIL